MTQEDEIREQRDRIRAQATKDEGFLPPAWKEEQGQLEGTVERILQVPDHYNPGKTKPALVIFDEKTESEITLYVNHRVLLSKLTEIRPKVGDWLLVKCHGKIEGKEKSYINYSVYTDRPVDTASIWSKAAAEQARTEGDWPLMDLPPEAEEGTGSEPSFE